jgi:hypothetical protein
MGHQTPVPDLPSVQDVLVRALRIGTEVIGVTREVEASWERLEGAAREHAKLRGDAAPHIRFRTDVGVSGALPVTEDVPIVFGDAEPDAVGRYGTIAAADGGGKVPVSLQSPEQIADEWPGNRAGRPPVP